MWHHDHDPPDGIEVTFVAGQALGMQIGNELLVCGHEDLERRAFTYLAGKIAGRAHRQPHTHTCLCLEGRRNFLDRELQVRSGRDDRRVVLSAGGSGSEDKRGNNR